MILQLQEHVGWSIL